MAGDEELRYSLSELEKGISGETGKKLDLIITVLGDLKVELLIAHGDEPAAEVAYEAKGPGGKTFSGKTDADGRIDHPAVTAGEWELTVNDRTFKVPTVKTGDGHHVRWISRLPKE